MILEKDYQRERAVEYARKYALVRNPLYPSFAGFGGNCTSFVSQCVLAGSCVMNFTPVYGWYFLSLNRRSASWSGVDYFYDFFINNEDVGPYGGEVSLADAQIGDVIQLSNGENFYHSLLISKIEENEIYICANSNDALDRPLSSYDYASLRVIHINKVRYDTRFLIDCFESLYSPPVQMENVPQVDGETEAPTDETPTENGTVAPQQN